jgi:TetR/AcrR family transcriptional regulator, ethionamide resistance regulator
VNPPPATTHQARTRHSREESRNRIIGAAAELVRTRSYSELSVGEIMELAGFGRTIFYRHFDDLADLMMKAGREAIDELFKAQSDLAMARVATDAPSIQRAIEAAVAVFERHGPLLRAVSEAAAADERVATGYRSFRENFDQLVADSIRGSGEPGNHPADIVETARALNLMNESYLLDAFGHEPRVSPTVAIQTLSEIWVASVHNI